MIRPDAEINVAYTAVLSPHLKDLSSQEEIKKALLDSVRI